MKSGEKLKDKDWDPNAYCAMENLFVEGTWNSKFADEVKPSESDIILKNRVNFSAFKGTALKDIIESDGITCLFVMGFLSNVSVEETTVEANELFPDLKIYVCSDGCAAKSKQVGLHTLNHILLLYTKLPKRFLDSFSINRTTIRRWLILCLCMPKLSIAQKLRVY